MPVLTSVLGISGQESGAYDSGEKYGALDHGDLNSWGCVDSTRAVCVWLCPASPAKIFPKCWW